MKKIIVVTRFGICKRTICRARIVMAMLLAIAGYAAQDASAQPTSRRFDVAVKPGDYVGLVQSSIFEFTGVSGSTLKSVKIVSLPVASAGRLVVETRYKPPKKPTISAVTEGQVIPSDVTRTREQGKPFLYFHASIGFKSITSFKFKVIDSNDNESMEYRAFILLPRPTSADFTLKVPPGTGTALTQSIVFPFNDKYGRTLESVKIRSLPESSQGKLQLETRYKPPKRPTISAVTVGQVIPSDVTRTREQGKPFLYFIAKSGFSRATFSFFIQADDSQRTKGSYVATLVAPASAPSFSETIGNINQNIITSVNKTLPEATGGTGNLTYSLSPDPPKGLSFDAATRTISGNLPQKVFATTIYTYKVLDSNNLSATLTFTITITLKSKAPPPDPEDPSDSTDNEAEEEDPPMVEPPPDPAEPSNDKVVEPSPKSPDFDGDGHVTVADFLLFVPVFGTSQGDVGYDAKYDLDSNGVIDVADFQIFVDNFGS